MAGHNFKNYYPCLKDMYDQSKSKGKLTSISYFAINYHISNRLSGTLVKLGYITKIAESNDYVWVGRHPDREMVQEILLFQRKNHNGLSKKYIQNKFEIQPEPENSSSTIKVNIKIDIIIDILQLADKYKISQERQKEFTCDVYALIKNR
jgi:hypothetical protein